MTENYSGAIFNEIAEISQKSSSIISSLITKSGDKEQDDLFAQQIYEQFNLAATTSCLSQLEELFCDFLGLHLFGEGYIHAFRYLIAPGGGNRSTKYPQTNERARLLSLYGKKLGVDAAGYEGEFIGSRDHSQPYEHLILRSADTVRDRYVEEMFTVAAKIVGGSSVAVPDEQSIKRALLYFEQGMPTDKVESIGSLITAAWRLYLNQDKEKGAKGSQSRIGYVSDLVLKSVEAHDFREDMKRA